VNMAVTIAGDSVKLVTYNMHGMNQGCAMLMELSLSYDVIFCQEHWLLSSQLHKLNDMIDGFYCISVSSMDDACCRGVLRGRPFGGLAILVRDTLCANVQCLKKTERLIAVKIGECVFINVYFPVYAGTVVYDSEVDSILCVLESLLLDHSTCCFIMGGDFNLEFHNGISRCDAVNKFVRSAKFRLCDDCSDACIEYTFCCESRNARSFIDHFLVSESLSHNVVNTYAVESGLNFSDHRPLALHIVVPSARTDTRLCDATLHSKHEKRIRWDKGDLFSYYFVTDCHLALVDYAPLCEMCLCPVGCTSEHSGAIDVLYDQIVQSLTTAARQCCPQTSEGMYKSYWDEEMSELKSRSVETHRLWVACGKPRTGPVYLDRCKARAEYRRVMKCKRTLVCGSISNELHEQLLSKDCVSFWHTWKKKVNNKCVIADMVAGCRDSSGIANVFACNFEHACQPNSTSKAEEYRTVFEARIGNYVSEHVSKPFTVELVDRCIRRMKLGKAAGIDKIETEHLLYAHPRLCTLLSLLFNCMMTHGRVPRAFGMGVMIPLLKDSSLDKAVVDNYRGINLSSHLSKLFEMCLLELYGDFLLSSDLQFGFKKRLGCNHALFVVKTVVDYFTAAGSVVNLCALDMSKAFDKVNHSLMFMKLMDRCVPAAVINVLVHWYGMCNAVVRWNGALSYVFQLQCGVRQGGVLSPVLFALYVDSLIENLRVSGYGCHFGDLFLGCVMYADDLLLLSASLLDLQRMIDVCYAEAELLDMVFNVKKSKAIRVGRNCRRDIEHVNVNGCKLQFVDEIKYLGWHIVSDKCFKVSLHHIRAKFYSAFNSLYAKSNYFTEPVLQYLVNAYCKCHLLYGSEVIDWTSRELSSISYSFNAVMCKIYRVNLKTIKDIYYYTGQDDVASVIAIRRRSFVCKMVVNDNPVIRHLSECFCS
jgi:exonuclease III